MCPFKSLENVYASLVVEHINTSASCVRDLRYPVDHCDELGMKITHDNNAIKVMFCPEANGTYVFSLKGPKLHTTLLNPCDSTIDVIIG